MVLPQADHVGFSFLLDGKVDIRVSRRLLGLFLGDIVDRVIDERSQENPSI